jgi:hypothetical protein
MQRFMMLFIGRTAQPDADDAQTQDYNRHWGDYMAGLARDGALESGAPFEAGGRTVGRDSVTPLELADVDIGGYVLISVESLDAAVDIARRAPHIALGGTTIVRPCLATGG